MVVLLKVDTLVALKALLLALLVELLVVDLLEDYSVK